jgi:Flp pilus assembly protein TadB
MLIALPVLAIAWIAYALWMRKVRKEEEQQGRPTSQRLQKTKSEVADWAKKMAEFESPGRRKKAEQEKQQQENRERDKPDQPDKQT